uniref:Protein quiver n=1 Tax=Timema tahoe TaxID=61484 RepID=A0A7R9NY80_9NEOP|nr:unnamed protein product [Timema tahoe]
MLGSLAQHETSELANYVTEADCSAIRCYESHCTPEGDPHCRLDDGTQHLTECHYANFLDTLWQLNDEKQPVELGHPVTSDRMWCAKMVGTVEYRTGPREIVYRACVPRDGERCRELMRLVPQRIDTAVGHYVKVSMNCTLCSEDACNAAPSVQTTVIPQTILVITLLATVTVFATR